MENVPLCIRKGREKDGSSLRLQEEEEEEEKEGGGGDASPTNF